MLISTGTLQSAAAQRSASPDDFASRSHRKLNLPPSSSSDFQQQLAQLRQLQALWQNQNSQQGDSDKGLSAFEKALAENMMRQTLKGGEAPKLDDLPSNLVSRVMSNQAARRDIQELLQKFRQDGLMPQGSGQGGGPSLPGRQPDSGGRENSSARVLREPGRGGSSDGSPRGNQTPGASSPTPTGTGDSSRRDTGDFSGMGRQPGPTAGQPRQNGETEPLTSPGDLDAPSRPATANRNDGSARPNPLDRQPGESVADHARRMGDYLEQKLKEKLTPQNPGNRTNDRQPGGSPATSGAAPGADGTPPVSMSDLLNEFGGLAGPQGGTNSRSNNDGRSNSERSNSGRNSSGNRSGDRPQDGASRNQTSPSQRPGGQATDSRGGTARSGSAPIDTSNLQEAARQTLRNRGLKAAINEVMNNARREVRQSSGRGSSSEAGGMSEGVRKAFVDALSGISDDVVEIARDARSRQRGRRSGNSSQSGRSGRSSGGSGSNNSSWIGQIRDSINSTSAPSAPAAGTGGMSAPNLSFRGGSLLSFLVIAAIVGGIAWWLLKSGQLTSPSTPPRLTAARIGAIRSRQDVVQAFHLIALDPRHGAEPWWHHEQVKTDLSARLPSRESSLADLTQLYEQARYLPDEVELNEAQLATARDAIERCRP